MILTPEQLHKEIEAKYLELKAEYQKMMDEFEYNKLIYEATFTFEPIIGKMYHLYKRKKSYKNCIYIWLT